MSPRLKQRGTVELDRAPRTKTAPNHIFFSRNLCWCYQNSLCIFYEMMCWFFALHENKKISVHTDVQFLIYQIWFICGESCSAVIVWKQPIYLWNHFISVEESIIFVIKQTITADVELFRCSGRRICDVQNHIQNSRTRIKFEAKMELPVRSTWSAG